jgi:sirohydrochlorin ferrochelatase
VPNVSDYSNEAADTLRSVGADPVVIGALAALRYRATVRETTDADFLVRRVPGIADAFRRQDLSVREMADADGEIYMYVVRGQGDVRVDVIVADTPFQREAMRRAVDGYITAEDVIVHKLIAWRQRDRDDIRSILVAGHDLDVGYIDHWAAEWDVSDRWAQAQAER